jgi:hypothetical protein
MWIIDGGTDMRKFFTIVVLMLMLSGGITVSACAQETGTSVFVVYGTMYEEDGITPVNDDYLITVEIPLEGRISTLTLGENDGIGRFSVVWIDYEGGAVVNSGDRVVVKAMKTGENTFGRYYTVTGDDVAANRVRIDIQRGVIAADNSTWGAIKSLYR